MVKAKKKGMRRPKSKVKLKPKSKHHFHNLKHTGSHRSFQRTILDHKAIEHVNKQMIILGISVLAIIVLALLLMYSDNFSGKAIEITPASCPQGNLCLQDFDTQAGYDYFTTMTAENGDVITINVFAHTLDVVYGSNFQLTYDSAIIEYVGHAVNLAWDWYDVDIDEVNGIITFTSLATNGVSGQGLEMLRLELNVIGNELDNFNFEFPVGTYELVDASLINVMSGVEGASFSVIVSACQDADADGHDTCDIGDDGNNDNEDADCDDTDNTIWENLDLYVDVDFDGYGTGNAETQCTDGSVPSSYSLIGGDCDDDPFDFGPFIYPGATENCLNAMDDDCDTLIDCHDDECNACVPEICDDSLDNDGDLYFDCYDSDCDPHYVCEGTETSCGDGLDDDSDTLIDCNDPDCVNDNYCIDADLDGYNAVEDCNDANATINPGAQEVCADGVDQDCDSLIDCADNSECIAETGPHGGLCEFPELTCDDGLDNDGDELIDCYDPDCCDDVVNCAVCYADDCTDDDADGYYVQAECGVEQDCDDTQAGVNPGVVNEVCADGLDNNCNGYVDCDPGGICQDFFGNGVICDFAEFEVDITVTEADQPFNVGVFNLESEYNITITVSPLLEDLPDNHLVIVQISDVDGNVLDILSEYQSSLIALGSEEVSFAYTPQESGIQTIEAFVWSDWLDLGGSILLSSVEDDYEVVGELSFTECGNDWDCIITEAETCNLANFTNSSTMPNPILSMFTMTSALDYEILGETENQCVLSYEYIDYYMNLTEESYQYFLDLGYGEEYINEYEFNFSRDNAEIMIGHRENCYFNNNDLAMYFTYTLDYLLNGTYVLDVSCNMDGECDYTMEDITYYCEPVD